MTLRKSLLRLIVRLHCSFSLSLIGSLQLWQQFLVRKHFIRLNHMIRTSHNEAIIISKHYSIWCRSTANVLRISLSCHVVDLQHIVVTLTCPIAQLIPCQLITRHMIRTSHNAPIIVFVFCVWNWQPYLSISPQT